MPPQAIIMSLMIAVLALTLVSLAPVAHALRCYSCSNLYHNIDCKTDNNPVHCGSSYDRCVTASFTYKLETNNGLLSKYGEVETFYRGCTTAALCKTSTAPCKDDREATCEYKCCAEDLCNSSARSLILITDVVALIASTLLVLFYRF